MTLNDDQRHGTETQQSVSNPYALLMDQSSNAQPSSTLGPLKQKQQTPQSEHPTNTRRPLPTPPPTYNKPMQTYAQQRDNGVKNSTLSYLDNQFQDENVDCSDDGVVESNPYATLGKPTAVTKKEPDKTSRPSNNSQKITQGFQGNINDQYVKQMNVPVHSQYTGTVGHQDRTVAQGNTSAPVQSRNLANRVAGGDDEGVEARLQYKKPEYMQSRVYGNNINGDDGNESGGDDDDRFSNYITLQSDKENKQSNSFVNKRPVTNIRSEPQIDVANKSIYSIATTIQNDNNHYNHANTSTSFQSGNPTINKQNTMHYNDTNIQNEYNSSKYSDSESSVGIKDTMSMRTNSTVKTNSTAPRLTQQYDWMKQSYSKADSHTLQSAHQQENPEGKQNDATQNTWEEWEQTCRQAREQAQVKVQQQPHADAMGAMNRMPTRNSMHQHDSIQPPNSYQQTRLAQAGKRGGVPYTGPGPGSDRDSGRGWERGRAGSRVSDASRMSSGMSRKGMSEISEFYQNRGPAQHNMAARGLHSTGYDSKRDMVYAKVRQLWVVTKEKCGDASTRVKEFVISTQDKLKDKYHQRKNDRQASVAHNKQTGKAPSLKYKVEIEQQQDVEQPNQSLGTPKKSQVKKILKTTWKIGKWVLLAAVVVGGVVVACILSDDDQDIGWGGDKDGDNDEDNDGDNDEEDFEPPSQRRKAYKPPPRYQREEVQSPPWQAVNQPHQETPEEIEARMNDFNKWAGAQHQVQQNVISGLRDQRISAAEEGERIANRRLSFAQPVVEPEASTSTYSPALDNAVYQLQNAENQYSNTIIANGFLY